MVFIVIDGLDASGKSTQALHLCRLLRKEGKTVHLRVHPADDNFFGVHAKRFLYSRGWGAHLAAAILYTLDVTRSILLSPWRRCDHVVFVRCQMGAAYLPSPLHRSAYHLFASIAPKSDLMFFLDVDPEEAHGRILEGRERREMFESLEELRRTRRKALAPASGGRWVIIDANKSEDDVATEIRRYLVAPRVAHQYS